MHILSAEPLLKSVTATRPCTFAAPAHPGFLKTSAPSPVSKQLRLAPGLGLAYGTHARVSKSACTAARDAALLGSQPTASTRTGGAGGGSRWPSKVFKRRGSASLPASRALFVFRMLQR